MAEFTGERVVPGQVEPDLWNEHISRYVLAVRRAAGRRVLDAGCGTGYGAAVLARAARSVAAMDLAPEAVGYAQEHFARAGLHFVCGSCASLPFAAGSFDLVVSFEVIEHLAEWKEFLAEIRRVLTEDGECIISTPNLDYYSEGRGRTGPNPYHVHEFTFEDFSVALGEVFPCVSMLAQNHVEGIGIQPLQNAGVAETALESPQVNAAESHYFVAICSARAIDPPAGLFYVPAAANILREREVHIRRLEEELATKDGWLQQANSEKQKMVEMFRAQTAELEKSNAWAQRTAEELSKEREELSKVVRLLDKAEATVVERSEWALRLDAQLSAVKGSRWYRLGRRLGFGPALGDN